MQCSVNFPKITDRCCLVSLHANAHLGIIIIVVSMPGLDAPVISEMEHGILPPTFISGVKMEAESLIIAMLGICVFCRLYMYTFFRFGHA